MSDEKLTYERAYAELRKILDAIQSEQIGLEELTSELKRAKELITFCRSKLRAVEQELDGVFDDEE